MLVIIKLKRKISSGLHFLLRWERIYGSLLKGSVTCLCVALEKASTHWATHHCEIRWRWEEAFLLSRGSRPLGGSQEPLKMVRFEVQVETENVEMDHFKTSHAWLPLEKSSHSSGEWAPQTEVYFSNALVINQGISGGAEMEVLDVSKRNTGLGIRHTWIWISLYHLQEG